MYDFWVYQQYAFAAPPPQPHHTEADVVTRHLHGGTAHLATTLADPAIRHRLGRLDLAGRGRLEINEPLQPTDGLVPTWRARGRLHGGGMRLVPFARVEIEVSAWSAATLQLRLRPIARHPFRWGVRRLRRYFDLAHLAGDHLCRLLSAAAPAEVLAIRRGCRPEQEAA